MKIFFRTFCFFVASNGRDKRKKEKEKERGREEKNDFNLQFYTNI